jgi:hypothetical protein
MQNANKTRGTGPLGGAGMVGLWGASSLIKSIQYLTSSINGGTVNVTISSVDTASSVAIPMGLISTYATAANFGVTTYRLAISSATNVVVSRQNWSGETAKFAVIEFMPGVIKSVQTGSCSMVGNVASATATVTAVNTNKALLMLTGWANNGDDGRTGNFFASHLTLTNSTTVTATRNSADTTYYPIVGFALLEFF